MSRKPTGRPPGRPPYPDILTPAEQRVLTYLRRGLTNSEIAEELGISLNGVKYHISNMLGKLGLQHREDLAVWHPQNRETFRHMWANVPVAVRLFAVSIAAASGVGIVVFAGFVIASLGNDSHESPSNNSGSSPTTAAPTTESSTPTASPSAVSPGRADVEAARQQYLGEDGLRDIDAALMAADADSLLGLWARTQVTCVIGSERTGRLCEGVPGDEGTSHQVELRATGAGGYLNDARAETLLSGLLEGNPASLVFIAHGPEDNQLLLGYQFSPRPDPLAPNDESARILSYLWLEVDTTTPTPVSLIEPLVGSPTQAYEERRLSPDDVIAEDPALTP